MRCVGSADVFSIIHQVHESQLHCGIKKTWQHIQEHYAGISRDEVQWVINHCQICVVNASNKAKGPLQPIIVNDLFERLQIDLVDMR